MNLASIQQTLTAEYSPWERLTLADRFDRLVERYADRPLVMTEARDWSYSEVSKASESVAAGLLALGIRRREHVAMIMANYPEYIIIRLALARIGAVAVPLNFGLKADENAYLLRQSDSVCLITMDRYRDQDYLAQLDEIAPGWRSGSQDGLPRLREVVVLPTGTDSEAVPRTYADVVELAASVPPEDVWQRQQESAFPDEVADILFTSGTTSRPKGAMLTHDMLWRSAMSTAYGRGYEDGWRLFVPIPLYHVFGYVEGLLGAMIVGGAIIPQVQFDPAQALRLMAGKQATEALFVPTILLTLLKQPELDSMDMPALRSLFCASAPAPVWLWEKAKDVFGLEEVHTGYGMTEVSAATVETRPGDPVQVVSSRVGAVLPGGPGGLEEFGGANTQYKTVDPMTGEDLPEGAEGELACRGNTVTRGYYAMPIETAEVIDKDGWLRTGDLGRIHPDGLIELTGRSKDLYKLNGENIIPREIEDMLCTHEAVEQAFVVGVPDERSGEIGVAFIVPRAGATVDPEDLRGYVGERLSRHKVPHSVLFLSPEELPTTTSGKVQKFRLRERAVSSLGRSALVEQMTGGGGSRAGQ
ncbi:class I adenylate-forming enzyme family protein [Brevibacterium spongiae]|uniref:AMP-binding protein n=1 Tax=Brevibacterium spongiae TaxID=2909672 RepID=A0ABY5SPL4_9MICO|nr:AMP-binding protein [Brevibacterium spongiae]UVI36427.1 AMP-binding protein [Brevibacterium spongiae]